MSDLPENKKSFLPLLLFWVGAVFFLFNSYLAIFIIFVSAVLVVKEKEENEGRTFKNINTFWKILWMFFVLVIAGFFILAVSLM